MIGYRSCRDCGQEVNCADSVRLRDVPAAYRVR